MEESESMSSPSGALQGTGEEVNAGAMKTLKLRLKHSQGCLEAVKKMPSPNFNQKQCGYLVDKLEEVVEVARSFFELSLSNHCGPDSSWNVTKWVGIFKLLLGLGKRIEDFIVECSKSAWVEAAMTLANVVEYVSSLGLNLELCKVLFLEGECAAMQGGLSLVEVDTLNKAEVEMVRLKAIEDEYLLKKVTLALETSDLAKYLLRRLVNVHLNPICVEGNIFGRLFAWVVSDMSARQLGEGASASVYEVKWLGIPVAQKIFFGVENGFFLREVEILSRLCHPNITSMFSSTMNKGNCSIIMELMDVDLYFFIQSRCAEQQSDSPPFSISVSLDLMLQIAEGVNYLHTQKIIHRDLKSKNILVKMVRAAEFETWYLQAKVVDFGISKTKEMSATKSCMTYNEGTDRWMAPELVRQVEKRQGEDDPDYVASSEVVLNYKFKCDVYSFAMVCYEILTREVPFKDEKLSRKIKQVALAGERPTLPTNCPTMLKALIEKCWNGNPKERPTFGTICSTLQFLKYMLMRGDITPEGSEARLDHTLSDGSGCSAEVVNSTCLPTMKVGAPSCSVFKSKEVDDVLPTVFSPLAVDGCQYFLTNEAFKTALSAFPTMEELETMNDPIGLVPKTEEEVNAGAMDSLDLRLKLLQGCLEAVKKMPSPNFNQKQCGYLFDKLEVVVEVARSFFEVSRFNHCGLDSSWNARKWVGIFKLLLGLGKQIEDFIVGCSMAAWMEAAMKLIDVAEYVSSLGLNLELCKALFLEGKCAAMQGGLTLVEVDTLNKAEVEMVRLKAIEDKEYLLRKVTLESDASDLAKYLLQRLVSVHPNPICNEGNIPGNMFDSVKFFGMIGRGSSASVYKVVWLETPMALKEFFAVDKEFFLKEVEILSQLHHPNIISMFASVMRGRRCSIIMDLMDSDLFTLIQRRCAEQQSDSPPFSLSESLDLMHQIAEGVNYLHTKRIVHMDLKSMNILVKMVRASEFETSYIQAKVVDFGISKTKIESATYSNMTYNQGTFRWMAPELVKPSRDDPDCIASSATVLNYNFKCDVYSFAMVCYEILTREVPFNELRIKEIKQLVVEGKRPTLPTNCPTMLKALIEKCWNGNPLERPTFGTICSTLQFLKYMLMRGDITPEGSEARLDHTLSDGSR